MENRGYNGKRYRSSERNDASREISSNSKRAGKNSLKAMNIQRVAAMVMCVVFLLFGSGLIYYYRMIDNIKFNQLGAQPTDGQSSTVDDSSLMSGNAVFNEGELLDDPQVLNIMLFGDDSRNVENGEFGRTDTMILLSVDNRHKKLKLTSFLRDTYVYIPGRGYNKINSSYASGGGPALAIQTIEANFGILIDRYAVVDFESFRNIIDILGGVEIELTQDEIDYINFQRRTNNETELYPAIEEAPGVIKLCGGQALWYARDRGWDYEGQDFKVPGDDWDRTSRQRNLLQCVANGMKSATLPQLIQVVSEIGPLITTNLKKNEITILVANALKYLTYEFEETSVPFAGNWKYSWTEDGQSIIEIVEWDECRNELAEHIYEEMVTGVIQN